MSIKFKAELSRQFENLKMEHDRSLPKAPGTLSLHPFVWGPPDTDGMLSVTCSADLLSFLRKKGFDFNMSAA